MTKPSRVRELKRILNNHYQNYRSNLNNDAQTTQEKLIMFFVSIATLSFVGLTGLLFLYSLFLPSVNSIQNFLGPSSTEMFDVNGKRLYTISADEVRDIIPISEMPQHLLEATIAIEDDQFYDHHGFDVGGILKAVLSKIGIGGARGGSTITQQLVKNTFLSPEKTLTRKIKELILSTHVERKFTKDEILGMYLNQIPYGGTAYGVEQASDIFFGKDAKDLTLAEAATLAALPQLPSYYSPFGSHRYTTLEKQFSIIELDKRKIKDISDLEDDEYAFGLLGQWQTLANGEKIYLPGRTDNVLKRMEDLDYITKEQYQKAVAESNTLTFKEYRSSIHAPHFVFYIRELLEDQFGKEIVESGGLKVYTSLDLEVQTKAEEIIAKTTERNVSRGASNMSLLSIDNKTGHILAMVGSADYFNTEIDGNVNIVTSLRQPGSSFKPIVYAKAFLNGAGAGSVAWDVRTAFGNKYTNNYDGQFVGPITIRNALGQSRNIPAIKAFYLADEEKGVIETASKMGITTINPQGDYGFPLALGTAEVKQLELTRAFSAFAQNGQQASLTPILRVEDAEGKVLYEAPETTKTQEVLDPQAAYLITNILSDKSVNLGSSLELSRPAGVKTGTSNRPTKDNTSKILPADGWTIGFTPQITTSVWSGNSNGDALKNTSSGYSNAAPAWKEFMEYVHKKLELPVENFVQPAGIKSVSVSKVSGLLAGPNTPSSMVQQDLFPSYSIPKEVDNSFSKVTVDIRNGLLPNKYCPEDYVKEAYFITPRDLIPNFRNWDEAIYAWLSTNKSELVSGDIFYRQKPQEISDLCQKEFAENPPSIQILTPDNFSNFNYGIHEITVTASAPNGIDRVDYYIDDTLQYTSKSAPYSGRVRITQALQPGSIHTVTAKVVDTNGYIDKSSITIKAGNDEFTSAEKEKTPSTNTQESPPAILPPEGNPQILPFEDTSAQSISAPIINISRGRDKERKNP